MILWCFNIYLYSLSFSLSLSLSLMSVCVCVCVCVSLCKCWYLNGQVPLCYQWTPSQEEHPLCVLNQQAPCDGILEMAFWAPVTLNITGLELKTTWFWSLFFLHHTSHTTQSPQMTLYARLWSAVSSAPTALCHHETLTCVHPSWFQRRFTSLKM